MVGSNETSKSDKRLAQFARCLLPVAHGSPVFGVVVAGAAATAAAAIAITAVSVHCDDSRGQLPETSLFLVAGLEAVLVLCAIGQLQPDDAPDQQAKADTQARTWGQVPERSFCIAGSCQKFIEAF